MSVFVGLVYTFFTLLCFCFCVRFWIVGGKISWFDVGGGKLLLKFVYKQFKDL